MPEWLVSFLAGMVCTVVGRHFGYFHASTRFSHSDWKRKKTGYAFPVFVELDEQISPFNCFLSFGLACCRLAIDHCKISTAPSPVILF